MLINTRNLLARAQSFSEMPCVFDTLRFKCLIQMFDRIGFGIISEQLFRFFYGNSPNFKLVCGICDQTQFYGVF